MKWVEGDECKLIQIREKQEEYERETEGERERKGDVNCKEEPVTTLTAVMATVGQTQETAGGDDVTRSKQICQARKIKMYMFFPHHTFHTLHHLLCRASDFCDQKKGGLLNQCGR